MIYLVTFSDPFEIYYVCVGVHMYVCVCVCVCVCMCVCVCEKNDSKKNDSINSTLAWLCC